MRTTARCNVLGLLLVLAGTGAHAQETVSPQRLGEFLGFVLMCECLPYESDHQQVAFYAMMVEESGPDYADTAAGYMRATMDGFYRNTASVCSGYVCVNDYTLYLGEVLAMIEAEPDDDFLTRYGAGYSLPREDEAPVSSPLPSWCAFRPFHPQCRTSP